RAPGADTEAAETLRGTSNPPRSRSRQTSARAAAGRATRGQRSSSWLPHHRRAARIAAARPPHDRVVVVARAPHDGLVVRRRDGRIAAERDRPGEAAVDATA